jgi:hypothetical protein
MSADQAVTILASIIGGGISGLAAVFAYAHGYLNIERIERRKQKIDLSQELMACRYVLVDTYSASDVDVRDFNRAMSRIPYVFSDNKQVIAAYDSFVVDKTTDKLLTLLEATLSASGLGQYAVSRSHLKNVMTVPRNR